MALELGLALVGLAMVAVIIKQRVTIRTQRFEIERLATTDPLTKLINRRGFDNLLDREVERAQRSDKFPSLIFMDVAGFTEINNQQGRSMGDDVLGRVAGAIRSAIRFEIDVPCRYGNDEFMVMLPETPGAQAQKVIERVQELLKSQHIILGIGIVECQRGWSAEVFLHHVGQDMFKHNQVKSAPAKNS